jgi:RHS repeat-associated protein
MLIHYPSQSPLQVWLGFCISALQLPHRQRQLPRQHTHPKQNYPYGMLQPGRSVSSGTYRFGYQGQEMDNAISALGQHLNYTYRNYDSWTARFGAIDPLAGKYPYWSPFAFSGNSYRCS